MNGILRLEHDAILELVRARTGLIFPETRRDGVAEAIGAAMAQAGLTDFAEYRASLARDTAFADLVDRLTVGETYFYRDPSHFRLVREEVLPAIEQRRGRRAARAWSAGCATGEEPYTLAMLFAESDFAAESTILATDISTAALAKARLGCYRPWSLRGSALAKRHLTEKDGRFCVDEALKRRVEFRALNLADAGWPSAETGTLDLDLVLCRNVLIYLAPDAIAAIARRFFDALADEGWLILGPSDPPIDGFAPFVVEVRDEGIVYRRLQARPVAAPRPRAFVERARARHAARKAAPSPRKPTPPTLPTPTTPTPRPIAPPLPSAATAPPSPPTDDEAAVRALAYREGTPAAERALREQLQRRPMAAELHYLHALLLTDLGRLDDAVDAARRVIYLQPDIIVAHLLLGTLQRRRGALADARRALEVAAQLIARQPVEAPVRLGEGQSAGQLAAMIDRELGDLGAAR